MIFVAGGIVMWGYFWIAQHNLAGVFNLPITINSVLYVAVGAVSLKLLFYLLMLRFIKPIKGRAIARRCHMCPRCGYDLRSRIDDAQPCPESGQRISRRECIRLWARFCGR